MAKGKETKMVILESGLDMASQLGLEGVSIGALAKKTNMSKSGLFAHFQSKENLQIEILDYAARVFSEDVIIPALATEAGITSGSSEDSARLSMGLITDPTPAAPAALRKSLRDQLLSVGAITFLHNS